MEFILGILLIECGLPLLDGFVQIISKLFEWIINIIQLKISRMTVETAKMQQEINDIEGEHEMTNTNAIGFSVENNDEYYGEE